MTTLKQFFQLEQTPGWAAKVVNNRGFETVRNRIAAEIKGFRIAPSFYELLIRETAELLEIDGADLIISAWRKRQEIIKYRDTQKYPPEKAYLVPLLEHTLTSKHAAAVEPVFNGASLGKIKFDITLKLNLSGAVLKIRNASIEEIQFGSCTGAGDISYTGVKILENQTAPFELQKFYKPSQPIPL